MACRAGKLVRKKTKKPNSLNLSFRVTPTDPHNWTRPEPLRKNLDPTRLYHTRRVDGPTHAQLRRRIVTVFFGTNCLQIRMYHVYVHCTDRKTNTLSMIDPRWQWSPTSCSSWDSPATMSNTSSSSLSSMPNLLFASPVARNGCTAYRRHNFDFYCAFQGFQIYRGSKFPFSRWLCWSCCYNSADATAQPVIYS